MSDPWLMASRLYTYPDTAAAQWVRAHPSDPRAAIIRDRIATVPQVLWLDQRAPRAWIAAYVAAAVAADALPTLAVYAIPDRDLGQYSAGGVATAADYRAFIATVVAAIGAAPCVVQLETDALIHCIGQPEKFQLQRFGLLQYAVEQFALRCPNTAVYLDGGDAWYMKPAVMAPLLVQAGIAMAAGFSVNVGQFQPTSVCSMFAAGLNAELATYGIPARAVLVDVSRNGAGRPAESYVNAHPDTWWCNPPGIRLGERPGLTGRLWVKGPGVSDGTVGAVSGVASGVFDPRLALAVIGTTPA